MVFKALVPFYSLTASVLRCEEPKNCLEWGAENVVLPRHYAEPGAYNPGRTPYLDRIAKAIMDPRYEMIVIQMASQSGKTLLLLVYMIHSLVTNPRPVIFAVPSKQLAKNVSRERFMDLVRGNEEVFALVKDGENSETYEKFVNGAPLRFVWTTSAVQLSSNAAGIVIIDERDRVKAIKGEGDAGELLETRTATYADRKILEISTPTIKDESPIEQDFEQGTKEVYYVLCPSCKRYFEPLFRKVEWNENAKDAEEVEKTARLVCDNCNYKMTDIEIKKAPKTYIGEGQKQGEGLEIVGELRQLKVASFRVNGQCSPWNKVGKLAARFWKASKDLDKKIDRCQAVINTGFGESFELKGESPDWEDLRKTKTVIHREGKKPVSYVRGELYEDITKVLITGDTHGLNVTYTIVGFNDNGGLYVIDYGLVHGDTREKETWSTFGEVCDIEFDDLRISKGMVDARYRTKYVTNFCRTRKNKTFYPAFGRDISKPVSLSYEEIDDHKRAVDRRSDALVTAIVNDTYWKNAVYERLDYEGTDDSTQIYLPEDVCDVFLKQLTGEERCTYDNAIKFKKTRANHFLDCVKMALCLGVEIMKIGVKKKPKKRRVY